MNATMQQKSTDPPKLRERNSRVSLPESTAKLFEAARLVLERRRLVKHSMSDTIVVALDAVLAVSADQVRLLSRLYVRQSETKKRFLINRTLSRKVRSLARKQSVSRDALLNSVATIFVQAALASSWKQNRIEYYELLSLLP